MVPFSEAFTDSPEKLEEIKKLIEHCFSIREVLLTLGVRDSPFAYRKFKEYCVHHRISYNFDQTIRYRRYHSLDEYLVENSTHRLNKTRLVEEGILEPRCYGEGCPITSEWLGKKIVLELDHINGDSSDNRKENIRFLCPNCHSQTATSNRTKSHRSLGKNSFCECGNRKFRKSKLCATCANKAGRPSTEKIAWPELNELVKLVQENGYSKAGRILGVSDNALRKRINRKNKLKSDDI